MVMNPDTSISRGQVEALIDAAEVRTEVFWDRETISFFKLKSGFTVMGRSAVVDPENFDAATGLAIAREQAINTLWQLEGYVLQLKLSGMVLDQRSV